MFDSGRSMIRMAQANWNDTNTKVVELGEGELKNYLAPQ